MRSLVRDAFDAVWLALTVPVKRLLTDAVYDALEHERRTISESWTDADDAAVGEYSEGLE